MTKDIQNVSRCLEQNTLIAMADGSMKRIKQIQIGDRVVDIEGRWVSQVINIWRGREEIMIKLTSVKGQIVLTQNHPVLSENGWILADAIRAGMMVKTKDDNLVEIKNVEYLSGEFEVYNLDTDSKNHILVTQWLIVGDNYRQNGFL